MDVKMKIGQPRGGNRLRIVNTQSRIILYRIDNESLSRRLIGTMIARDLLSCNGIDLRNRPQHPARSERVPGKEITSTFSQDVLRHRHPSRNSLDGLVIVTIEKYTLNDRSLPNRDLPVHRIIGTQEQRHALPGAIDHNLAMGRPVGAFINADDMQLAFGLRLDNRNDCQKKTEQLWE